LILYNDLSEREQNEIANINRNVLSNSVIIDFEGPIAGSPELVGYLKDGKFKTIFLNDVYESCARRYDAEIMSLDEFAKRIQSDIEEQRMVISYSFRELNVLENRINIPPTNWYRDAHKYFKKVVFNHRRPRPRNWKLDSILEFYNIPKRRYPDRSTSQNIQKAKMLLSQDRIFETLPRSIKRRLTSAVNYNEDDVKCLFKALSKSLN
jgi:hypothetical protein